MLHPNKQLVPQIKLLPVAGSKKLNIQITMPYWIDKNMDGNIYINMALLGGITIFVKKEEEIDVAIHETLTAFFNAAGKHGKGIKQELMDLGWKVNKNNLKYRITHKTARPSTTSFIVHPDKPVYQQMMHTGSSKYVSLQV